jgi:arylsulfatase A-like enzyme
MKQPNVVFLFADQWRAQAVGYAGDPNVKTPCLDALSRESVMFTGAVSNCPICTPYRASLLSGQYPLTNGLFMNDLCLPDNENSIAQVLKRNGYDTAYIGKWHLDGHGRSAYIPPERRQGFDYWKVLECTHDYNNSFYYSGGSAEKRRWPEYDAFAQTADAEQWLAGRKEKDKPFILLVSYGTPHNPYQTAPEEFKALYDPQALVLRENVPAELAEKARVDLVGYYAHITALDQCVWRIDNALKKAGLGEDTIFIVTSDHGDSMESQCDPAYPGVNKQRPYDESVMVPLLIRGPGLAPRKEDVLIASPDLMPTILGLCGVSIPATVEGMDYSAHLKGGERLERDAVLIASYSPFADWRPERGGREFRGIRTPGYTYVEDIEGPWLMFDNGADPYQLKNMIRDPAAAPLRAMLADRLNAELKARNDPFLPAAELRKQWNYPIDAVGAIPYTN